MLRKRLATTIAAIAIAAIGPIGTATPAHASTPSSDDPMVCWNDTNGNFVCVLLLQPEHPGHMGGTGYWYCLFGTCDQQEATFSLCYPCEN